MMPIVSIIMLSFNSATYIAEAIESILQQDFKEWELIIVENGSTDDSWEILKTWIKRDEKISAVHLRERVEIPVARNIGVTRAKGVYLATLDSDDTWMPQRLSRQLEFMEQKQHSVIGVCGANCVLIDCHGRRIGHKRFPESHAECLRALWFRNPFCHSATLVRRQCVDEMGPYDPSFKTAQDLELWFRLGQRFQFHNLPDYLVRYRLWQSNVTYQRHRTMVQQTIRARRMAVERYGYHFGLLRRTALAVTWGMQWFPPDVSQRLFRLLVLRQFRTSQ